MAIVLGRRIRRAPSTSARWSRRARARVASLILAALATAPAAGSAYAAEIAGISFAEQLRVGPEGANLLTLRGLGLLRFRVVLRGYVAALYLPPRVPIESVLREVPRRLEIQYFWGIGAAGFAKATNEGIQKNVSPERWRSLQPHVEQFNDLYLDVEPGDRYALTYLPGRGTELALNGKSLGSVESPEFGAALFAIWLGEDPFDASLKEQLLRGLDSD